MSESPTQYVVCGRNGLRFEGQPTGREIAYRGDQIVGDIIPNGFGWGGWVTVFNLAGEHKMPEPARARSRKEAREIIEANVS